jgi:hypothetical protein
MVGETVRPAASEGPNDRLVVRSSIGLSDETYPLVGRALHRRRADARQAVKAERRHSSVGLLELLETMSAASEPW